MRRSRLIALGYVVAGVLFLVYAVTGATTEAGERAVTWGVLGVIWFLFSGYAVLMPDQFDGEIETRTQTESKSGSEEESVIGYVIMFSVVLVLILVLGVGGLLNLLIP